MFGKSLQMKRWNSGFSIGCDSFCEKRTSTMLVLSSLSLWARSNSMSWPVPKPGPFSPNNKVRYMNGENVWLNLWLTRHKFFSQFASPTWFTVNHEYEWRASSSAYQHLSDHHHQLCDASESLSQCITSQRLFGQGRVHAAWLRGCNGFTRRGI